ncbi:Thioredoxin-like [2Fe-2S] ferredoxin [Sporobacter termitidis DSM 10068]|uniref:Thioredoxin-like [2Fe-2S] ferredoxin n=1 Tax=Sporobacter termitidis DSM 10068 TaxID=1123282 RepID=A0A1M5YDS6_9FIRM|nr:NAD(P)H-dependent oxidoreductase subunit E [Sporobacter termitidis]SHI10008.1 Thioredoxin-like [2Fe-2S] ferredoxin [Sporobacter termitidis DSM 10068]
MPNQTQEAKLTLNVCFGTSCFVRGARELYTGLMDYVKNRGIADETEFKVSFCCQRCEKGPILAVNGRVIERCTVEKAAAEIEKAFDL